MGWLKEFKKGDLVRHVYNGEIGILLKIRPIDILTDAVGEDYHAGVYDGYVLFSIDTPTWVPLEHIKKI